MTTYQFLSAWITSRIDDERGASLVEYALLVALIAVVCIAAVTALLWSACAPKLVVQHDDPLGPPVIVSVTDGPTRTVSPGDSRTLRVRPGMRHIDVRVAHGDDPWGLPGNGWQVLVDRRLTLTLFRPEAHGER